MYAFRCALFLILNCIYFWLLTILPKDVGNLATKAFEDQVLDFTIGPALLHPYPTVTTFVQGSSLFDQSIETQKRRLPLPYI
jgi:hypothetical protein